MKTTINILAGIVVILSIVALALYLTWLGIVFVSTTGV